jgi:phosphomannomutase
MTDDEKLDALFADTEIRGDARSALDDATLERLGRGLGTLARRRGLGRTTFVFGRDDHVATGPARDALLRGVVLSGHEVVDVGIVDPARHEFALNELVAPAGVRLGVSVENGREQLALEVFLGGGPLVGAALRALADVVKGGDFSSGDGALRLFDIEPAYRAAARHGMGNYVSRDTVVH